MIGLDECDPSHFWDDLINMWQFRGIRERLTHGGIKPRFALQGTKNILKVRGLWKIIIQVFCRWRTVGPISLYGLVVKVIGVVDQLRSW